MDQKEIYLDVFTLNFGVLYIGFSAFEIKHKT